MVLTEEVKEQIWLDMMNGSLRLLGLYELRLKYLETRDERLELCRHLKTIPESEREEIIDKYTEHFENKIRTILFDIDNIKNKNDEYMKDYCMDFF